MSGGTPLAVADAGKLLGVVHLKDIVKPGHQGALRGAPLDGHPHGDGDRRQSDHRRGDRLGSRRRRFSRRGDAGGQAPVHPQGAVRRPAHRHVRRRHQRRAGARPSRRRRRDADRNSGGPRSGKHGGSQLQSDQAHRDRRDRQAAPDDPRLTDDLLHRQRRRQIFRHPARHVRGDLSGARRAQRDAARLLAVGDPVGGHLQCAHHHCADPAGAEGRRLPAGRRGGAASAQSAHLRPGRPRTCPSSASRRSTSSSPPCISPELKETCPCSNTCARRSCCCFCCQR